MFTKSGDANRSAWNSPMGHRLFLKRSGAAGVGSLILNNSLMLSVSASASTIPVGVGTNATHDEFREFSTEVRSLALDHVPTGDEKKPSLTIQNLCILAILQREELESTNGVF